MSSLGGHRRSGASGNHDESGDSMGHGGIRGLSEQWRGAPPMKVLGELHYLEGARTSRGILEVLGLGGARKALN